MDEVVSFFKHIDPSKLNYSNLFDKIIPFVNRDFDLTDVLPKLESKTHYARNILMLHPLELVLIHWPAGSQSAIHHHEGFWGYVAVLSGKARNVEYAFKHEEMQVQRSVIVEKNGIIPEPDGVIHKLENGSREEPLITLHFYYPALRDLKGLKMYGEDGTFAILNENASSASLDLPEDCYSTFRKHAFTLQNHYGGKTHLVSPILPKPSSKRIKQMVAKYYAAQAMNYDQDDMDSALRKGYVQAINRLIAEDFKLKKPEHVCAIACGTGRRAIAIQELAGVNYRISGVDLSPEMCKIAKERGLEVYCMDWLELEVPNSSWDAVTMLYSFGHVPTALERIQYLEKVYDKLKPGAAFYFDLFDINDPYEWGSKAIRVFEEYNLDSFGYEKGDVFYHRADSENRAFLHYFDEEKTRGVLESIGFKVAYIKHIGYMHRCGEELDSHEGCLFIKVTRP
jgi:ubiquinone/menaquinone biosynthesis C-methylase UbiE/predicted metal-dependent enzyme (double-stranded beta helix superfamily)